jgi:hypothetical protein
MHFHIVKMYKDKEVKKNVKNIFLSMCDVRMTKYGVTRTPLNKGNNKITEFRTILQRESQNS